MKKLYSIALVLALCGCVTTPEGKKRPDPVIVTGAVKIAVEDTAILYMIKEPASRPAFEKARTAASDLLVAGEGTTDDLKKIFEGLPIKEFQSNDKKIQLVTDHAVFVVNLAAKWTLGAPATDRWKYFIQPVAKGIVDGLDTALAQ